VWQEYKYDAPQRLPIIHLYNLLLDPRERNNIQSENSWVLFPVMKIVNDFQESLKAEPPIPPGTADPYSPPKGSR